MSADRQRLKSAIRRIALTPEERRALLGDGANKGGQPSSAGVGTSEAEESRLCCDGSTSSNPNPGTSERDPDAEGAGQDGLDASDPASLDMGDGCIDGVTDCATGTPVKFCGEGFVPPAGWDDPSEPPVDPTYEEGAYWGRSPSGSLIYAAPATYMSCEQYIEANFSGEEYEILDTYISGEEQSQCEFRIISSGFEDNVAFQRHYCDIEPQSFCGDPPPVAESWPEDGAVNLAIVNGKIVGSKYDPENDGSYSAPRDSIDLCSGTDQISLAPSADGGWKTINSTTNNGYLYDSSGQQIAHIDGNEYSDPNV